MLNPISRMVCQIRCCRMQIPTEKIEMLTGNLQKIIRNFKKVRRRYLPVSVRSLTDLLLR